MPPSICSSYVITGLFYDETTTIKQIEKDFSTAVKAVYTVAKQQNILRYNDVRPIISDIAGVIDFEDFLMNGERENIQLNKEEYPETGSFHFS